MTSKQYQRHYSFLEPLHIMERNRQEISSGTFSPETIVTTSSGYSTGDSSILTKTSSSSSSHQHKTRTKSLTNLLRKLKNRFLTTNKSKEMPLITIQTQGSIIPASTTISLPFTYYQRHSPMEKVPIKHTNFDQISAWLDRTELDPEEDIFFLGEHQPSTSANDINQQQFTMKKTPTSNARAPKRSTSLVSTLTRPLIEKRSISPSSSFSSSILIRGMSESLTPQQFSHVARANLLPDEQVKVNRRRMIDFSRRRTTTGFNEPLNNKENQRVYHFSSAIANQTQFAPKKYYFRRDSEEKTDDVLMNSYGLKILQQDKPKIYSSSIENFHPKSSSSSSSQRKTSISHRFIHPQYSSDSLEDLLCDREVESYFYPSPPAPSQHIYINLQTPIHGTLC